MTAYRLPILTLALPLFMVPAWAGGPVRTDRHGDPLPTGALLRFGSLRFRTPEPVLSVAFSTDGKTLVSAGSGRLTFWDPATGKVRRIVSIDPGAGQQMQFSADGKVLALSGPGTIWILDGSTGAVKKFLQDPTQRNATITASLSPDGKTAAMLHRYERQLVLWDVETETIQQRIPDVYSYNPAPVLFTRDSKQCITLWTDGRLHLVDVARGKSIRNLEPDLATPPRSSYSTRVPAMALSPDGKHLCYRLEAEKAFQIIELATSKRVAQVQRPSTYSWLSQGRIEYTPNGRFLVEATGGTQVRVWGVASGKLLRELEAGPVPFATFSLSPDGKRAACPAGNAIHVWDLASGKTVAGDAGHRATVSHVLFSPDGKQVLTMGGATLRAWDVASGQERARTLPAFPHGVQDLMFTDGKALRWVNGSDRALYQWDLATEPRRISTPRTAPYFTGQCLSPDGRWLAGINSTDRKLRLLDLTGQVPDRDLAVLPYGYNNQLVFSPDARLLGVGATDRSVTLFETATGREQHKLALDAGASEAITRLAPVLVFSPDNRALLVSEGGLRVVETLSGAERQRLAADGVRNSQHIAWSANGQLVARADGSEVVIYEVESGLPVVRLAGEQGKIHALAFSRDGRRLATAGADTTVLLWEVPALERSVRVRGLSDSAAWRDLGELDARVAFRAMSHLSAAPDEAIRLIRKELEPPAPVDPKRLSLWIEQLDSDSYALREAASDELARLGPLAEPYLRRAQKGLSLEGRRRIEDLLGRLGGALTSERLRLHRAVEVLERLDTPLARETLRGLLRRKLDPTLESAVRASLSRMSSERP